MLYTLLMYKYFIHNMEGILNQIIRTDNKVMGLIAYAYVL